MFKAKKQKFEFQKNDLLKKQEWFNFCWKGLLFLELWSALMLPSVLFYTGLLILAVDSFSFWKQI